MPYKPKTFRPAGAPTKQEQRKAYDKRRGTTSERGGIYWSKWWAETRRRIAIRDLYQCKRCGKDVGQAKGDFICDHIEERPAGAGLNTEAWDRDGNLQTLCVPCANAKSGRYGRRQK